MTAFEQPSQNLLTALYPAEIPKLPQPLILLFSSQQSLHAARIVHRDVKPLNLLFCEDDKRFCFIDLGACVDMGNGTNFDPESSIFDPLYCAPEEVQPPTPLPMDASPLSIET